MKKSLLLFTTVFITAFFIGFFTQKYLVSNNIEVKISRTSEKSLTSPLLDCEVYEQGTFTKINQLKKKVESLLNSNKDIITEGSVYYRDLNNGPSFGINENNKFAPASLLKVPLMIAYLKRDEEQPGLLNQKIKFQGKSYLNLNLPKANTLTPGSSYTIDNLIYRMSSLSDNIAFETLLENIDASLVKKVHKDLDLVYPDNNTPEDFITVKTYAGLFRVLYNATYLNRDLSEKALSYLTKSDFKMGIIAGLPKGTKTALKFGIRDLDQEGLVQIHDCGIVYSKKKTYLLCVMTKGKNNYALADLIKKISATVYEGI